VAARPLLTRLDDDQKMAAARLAEDMGLGPVVAALN
jgi:antitoxin component of RelBE/YafQ-DinJ toxin-antitoxin module